ncbi:hypothetical protein GMAR_ORF291 [Golden Marseillevirus]|uniref:hypothetical protein n=1 Tax=Golden Marseillevirus TaxID=1720526 RepID=UPI000877ACD6|nr:hypothetical protein GMAR_ORF291 [Golden Marseillevirus]ALX27665.1 hypothetical protein GMAR_ORF291 [Golden Marseillevirus]
MQARIREYQRIFPTVKNLRITNSDRSQKRYKATFLLDGEEKTVHFGQRGAFTYADGAPESKRRAYRARHSKILNKGRTAYKVPGSASSLAWVILW